MRAVLVLAALAAVAATASAATPVTAAQLTTCKAALAALGIPTAGNTFFCPTNKAFADFADDLGFDGPNKVSDLLAAAKANPAAFKTLLSYHAVKGVVTAANVKSGAVPTLAGVSITLDKDAKGGVDIEYADVGDIDSDAEEADKDGTSNADVVAADLTLEGKFAKGGAYVVHAIDEVMVPPSAVAALKKIKAANEAKRDA